MASTLYRDSAHRVTQLLRQAGSIADLGPEISRLTAVLAEFERTAGQTRVLDLLADRVAAGDTADQPLMFAAALAERSATSSQAAEIVAGVRERMHRRIRDAAAADGERIYRAACEQFDAAAGKFLAANAIVDVEAAAETVVELPDKARKAWREAPTLEIELDRAATALHACGVLSGYCADNPDAEIDVCADTTGIDRAVIVAAWNIRTTERKNARTAANGSPFTGLPAAIVSRTGRWGALLTAGATIRAASPDLVHVHA